MAIHKQHFVVDVNGKKTAVLLDIEEYEKLIDDEEELEAIRACDASKATSTRATYRTRSFRAG